MKQLPLFILFLFATASQAAEPAERSDAFVHGRVLGISGEPYAGATIHACSVETAYGRRGGDSPPCTTEAPASSGAGGDFVLGPLPPGWYEIHARAPGLVDGVASRVRAAGGETVGLEIRLRPGFTVHGKVIDEGGRPVAGAAVEAWTRTSLSQAVAGDDGAFRLSGVGPGEGSLQAEADGYWPGAHFLRAEEEEEPLDRVVTLRKKDESEIGGLPGAEIEPSEPEAGDPVSGAEVLEEEPGVMVRGRFRDLAEGEIPIIYLSNGSEQWRANVEIDGSWWVSRLPEGTWKLSAFLPDERSVFPDGGRRFEQTIEIPPGVPEIELELDFAIPAEGQVAPVLGQDTQRQEGAL